MLTKKSNEGRNQVEFNSLEDLVPKDHLLRKIENALDFNFIYDEVAELYSAIGRPSIDPVVLIKIVLIQYLFGISSMLTYGQLLSILFNKFHNNFYFQLLWNLLFNRM